LDREQEPITVIHVETKRTEEKEEAGYRLPTWSILRALQKIYKAKRLEGEATMSSPPFFQSAGRRDLKFWGEDDGPTVVVWERLSESEQEQWSKKMGKSKDWVAWCRWRDIDGEPRPFEADGNEIFSNRSKQAKAKAKAGEKLDKKGGKEQSVRWKAWWQQSNIECAVSEEDASCWIHQDYHVADEKKAALKKAAEYQGEKTNVKCD